MPHNPRPQIELLERRKNVAERYLRGETQWEIARAFELNQGTVSRDLKALQEEWLKAGLLSVDQRKAREVAKIDRLERVYWQAWEDSKRSKLRTRTRKWGERMEASREEQQRDGDPRYLQGVLACIERRCAIFGVTAKPATGKTNDGQNRQDDGAEVADALLAELRAAVERRRGEAGGAPDELPGADG